MSGQMLSQGRREVHPQQFGDQMRSANSNDLWLKNNAMPPLLRGPSVFSRLSDRLGLRRMATITDAFGCNRR
jgi:hypothetical protein